MLCVGIHKKVYIAHLEICGFPLEEQHHYECEECGKSRAHKQDLTRHMRTHQLE